MKKTFYLLFMFIGLVFTGCEPMEDIHDQIDAEFEGKVAGTIDSYVLTEDDYKETLGFSFANFGSVEEAKELVPVVLNDVFPSLGAESSVNVSFDLYDPIRIQEYTMGATDYETIGIADEYISASSQIRDFLSTEFSAAEEGDYVELTYNAVAEEISYKLNDSDFELIEAELSATYPGPAANAGEFGSFDVRDWSDNYWNDEMILEAINIVLSNKFDDVPGQTYNVSYDVYYPATQSMNVVFDGNSYVAIGGGGIPYTLTEDDFVAIGDEFITKYPDAGDSAGYHKNFERRTDDDAYWSDSMIEEALNFLLKQLYPDASEGEEYSVTYDTYIGEDATETVKMVLENGEFILVKEVFTVVETSVYAFTNNSWNMPFTLELEDYESMGQSHPNFSDEDEAIYKIGIFLGLEFPYAAEGDFAAVQYNLFSFSDYSTSIEYLNYFFNGEDWVYIPSVVRQSLQFGHDGTNWVPDNTIRYTLSKADYGIIESAFINKYPGPADNAGHFGSFDVRETSDNYWDDEMLLEAFNAFLNEVHPDAEIGQKYVLSYQIYNGSTVTMQISLIKTEEGWVINE